MLIASLITAALVFLSDGMYIVSILKGVTKPSRSSFWVWTLVQGMTAASYFASGGGYAVTLSAAYAVGFLLIAFLSLHHGSGHWERLDTVTILAAVAVMVIWALTGQAVLALMLLLFTDAIGAVPTLKKAWLRPTEESRPAWVLTCLATVVTIFSVQGWQWADKAYLLYMLLVNGSITILLLRPRGSR